MAVAWGRHPSRHACRLRYAGHLYQHVPSVSHPFNTQRELPAACCTGVANCLACFAGHNSHARNHHGFAAPHKTVRDRSAHPTRSRREQMPSMSAVAAPALSSPPSPPQSVAQGRPCIRRNISRVERHHGTEKRAERACGVLVALPRWLALPSGLCAFLPFFAFLPFTACCFCGGCWGLTLLSSAPRPGWAMSRLKTAK